MVSFLGLGLIGNRLKEVCAIGSEQRVPSNAWHLGQKLHLTPGPVANSQSLSPPCTFVHTDWQPLDM